MKHSNASLLEKIYPDFTQGRLESLIAVADPQISFQISGKSGLAGKYDLTTFEKNYFTTLKERSGGTYQFEAHDILASDLHATVLGTAKLSRGGKTIEYRTVHVWRFQNGKPLAWYEYPRDLYQYDTIWS